jgi:putative endonuclease
LVYYETFSEPRYAIMREKVLKGWVRKKKVALIEKDNPSWDDLSLQWPEFKDAPLPDYSLRSE